jgi:hypothetical protein
MNMNDLALFLNQPNRSFGPASTNKQTNKQTNKVPDKVHIDPDRHEEAPIDDPEDAGDGGGDGYPDAHINQWPDELEDGEEPAPPANGLDVPSVDVQRDSKQEHHYVETCHNGGHDIVYLDLCCRRRHCCCSLEQERGKKRERKGKERKGGEWKGQKEAVDGKIEREREKERERKRRKMRRNGQLI